MVFDIKGKVAVVTGGVSGIGLSIVKALLDQGVKAVVIADINEELAKKVTPPLAHKYGFSRVTFIKTDVSDLKSFRNAFENAKLRYRHVDMLFNNAGIFNEIDFEKCVDINLKGSANGMLLASDTYLKKHKQGDEAVIVNTCCIAGPSPIEWPTVPIYISTKCGILALTKSYEEKFKESKIRTIAICPGATQTPLFQKVMDRDPSKNYIKPENLKVLQESIRFLKPQSAHYLAEETLKIVKNAPSGSIWVIEDEKPAYQFILPDRKTFEKNTLKNKI